MKKGYIVIVVILAVGYFLGAKFPNLAMRSGLV